MCSDLPPITVADTHAGRQAPESTVEPARPATNVRYLRPHEPPRIPLGERRQVTLDALEWSLMLKLCEDAGKAWATDLAETILAQLAHPASLTVDGG